MGKASLILISIGFNLSFIPAHGEMVPDRDAQFLQMMQQRAEEARMEDEFVHPKRPDVPKERAVRGSRKAPIQIVEYSDFQCPYCSRGFSTVEEIRSQYGKKVSFLFKHMPLPFHPLAMPAAKRFEAITLQSVKKAYQFHDEVFKNQQEFVGKGEAFLDDLAKRLKVNVAKMKTDMEGEVVKDRISKDQAEAQKFGIQGTPAFVVAGVLLKGAYPKEAFDKIIERRLKEKRSVSGKKSSE